MLVILATQEAENRRMAVQDQPRQIVHETLSQKYSTQKHRAGEVAQVVGSVAAWCPEVLPSRAKELACEAAD
jgi:hypothetical protein